MVSCKFLPACWHGNVNIGRVEIHLRRRVILPDNKQFLVTKNGKESTIIAAFSREYREYIGMGLYALLSAEIVKHIFIERFWKGRGSVKKVCSVSALLEILNIISDLLDTLLLVKC